jgi:hypothetical protein
LISTPYVLFMQSLVIIKILFILTFGQIFLHFNIPDLHQCFNGIFHAYVNFHCFCSDVALVTSLRDGMNLVSYEYVACQGSKKGVLILSEVAD